jgi:dihydroorotate dehydrogenase electron transfer subunit
LKQVSATIVSNTELMPGYHLICLEAAGIAAAARPGQFVMVNCGQGFTLHRPLSIHQVANSGQLHLLFGIVGKGTSWLSRRQEGETLDLLGPLGNGFSIEPASRKLLLVAGGIGIAPLTFLAQRELSVGKSVTLLLGAGTDAGLYPQRLLPGGIETVVATEDGSIGRKGMITDILPGYIDWADQICACGPLAMYQTMAGGNQQTRAKKPVQISLEVRMGCGLGACYGCSIRTRRGMKQVCLDGPVFNLDEIIWQEVKI